MNNIHNQAWHVIKKAALFSFLVSALAINILFLFSDTKSLNDFGSFYAAGVFAREGKNPYSIDSPLIFSVEFPNLNAGSVAPNLNPPVSIFLFQAISYLPPKIIFPIWRILSAATYLISIVLLLREYSPVLPSTAIRALWVFCLAGFWHTIQMGQVYSFLLLISIFVLIFIRRDKRILAGIFLGILIALKPNFAIWALLYLTIRNWKIFFSAAIAAIALSALPALKYGPHIYTAWLEATTSYSASLIVFPGNSSLQGLFARLGSPLTGIIVSIVLGLGLMLYSSIFKPGVHKVNSLGVIASLLVSPLAWTGYMLLCVSPLFSKQSWGWLDYSAAILFTVPFYIVLSIYHESSFGGVFLGWCYGWGLVLLFLSMVIQRTHPTRA